MPAATHKMSLPGAMLHRGFWLYVWRIEAPNGEMLYVGRTGDNSTPHATAPYTRMGQHLGFAKNQNALRKHLQTRGIDAGDCSVLHLIAHGPIHAEVARTVGVRADWMKEHIVLRDKVGAMEKALADDLADAGYTVLNTVKCKWPLDLAAWTPVRAAFAAEFPKLLVGMSNL